MPATLAVMAVAALLAFGLMATTGAQPAAAQAKADCTVTLNASGDDVTAEACTAMGDTAIVEFVGNTGYTEDATLSILIADKSGPITAYPNGTSYADATGFSAASAKYRYQTVELAEPAPDSQGIVQPSKVRVTVPGNIFIWVGTDTSVTSPITDAPNNEREISGGGDAPEETLTITFLGMPALGKDLDSDYNKKLDDDIMEQCIVQDDDDTNDARQRLVGEGATGYCDDAVDGREADDWEATTAPRGDAVESRSKLVVRAGLADASTGTAQAIIDGKEVTHTVAPADTAVTIYALIQDAKGQNLLETPVDFTATTNPSGIISQRELSDDPETAAVGTATGEINVAGLATPGADVPVTAEIDDGDAVAAFTLDDLNEIEGAFSVSVNVTVGSLDLGTVIITRPDTPETLHAGIFSMECFTKAADATDYETAKFNMDNDDCDAMGDSGRFGHGQMVFVKAHLEDSLGNVVGASADLDSELTNEDDDLLGDGRMTTIETPVEGKTEPRAWLYMIDDDATLGDHMITVSTTAKGEDDEGEEVDIDDVMLTVTVAGPPANFMIQGPSTIDLNGSGTFTVTATDAAESMPYFKDDASRMVPVFIQGLTPGNVRGLSSTSMLALNADTAMGSFTIYAPPGTTHGATVRIFVSSGDSEKSHTVMFGGNRAPMAGAAIDDVMVYTGMTATAMSTITDPDGDMLTWTAMSDDEMVATAEVNASGMVTITGVSMGTATITVTASDPGGMSAMQMINVTVMDEPMPVMAASGLSAQANGDGTVTLNWTPGPNATHHFVAGTADSGATWAVWQYSDGMDTHTTMAGDLTLGTEYTFYILAGQFEEDDRGNWDGDWADWSNSATATPMMSSGPPIPPPPTSGG